jgi:hypothetical protein
MTQTVQSDVRSNTTQPNTLGAVQLGHVTVSRLIIGGNPFSGFSHQSTARDHEMRSYYTMERLKETLRRAEAVGIRTHLGRADHFVMRMLLEYWNEGGGIDWIAQTCPEVGTPERGALNGIQGGAKACFIHGGVMDALLAQQRLDTVAPVIEQIRDAGLAAGIAGHDPRVFEWAREHLDVDFFMCSHYNPIKRGATGEHIAGTDEQFLLEDRERMLSVIATLSKPVIHYKIMAAGRNNPREAFAFLARHLRPQDAVCVGVFLKDNPDMLAENARLFSELCGNAAP